MAEGDLRWYILFANYEQGLALHDLLTEAGIKNAVEAARRCIEEHHAEYHDIVPLAGQIRSRRDRYC